MKYIGLIFLVFMAGGITAINLSMLVETNPLYEASWIKVVMAGVFAIVFGTLAKENI